MPVTQIKNNRMARKTNNTEATRGRPRSKKPPGIPVSARLPENLVAALDTFIDELKPKPDRKAVIIDALERYLKEKGYWPPPTEPQEET